ncbi:MAG: N-acetyltransferase family protein [Halodesulfurarchaeum sp.]
MIRPYEPADRADLWRLKRSFELAIAGSGDEEGATAVGGKEAAYREKLTDDYRRSYLEWVERCTAERAETVQVAEKDGNIQGYVFVLPESISFIWDAAVLNELFVAAGQRGTGIADELMEAALALARTQDTPMDRIVLDVDPENDRARTFYERWGFEPWGMMRAREL